MFCEDETEMSWINDLFKTTKPVIAMVHMPPLPGDPGYDAEKGMGYIIEHVRADLEALQAGGVDAVMFSNEASLPYLTDVEQITVACMARVIGELLHQVRIPFGVNVLWDPYASLDLAKAVGASFVREIFTGVYASDFGLWNTNAGKIVRHQHAIGAQDVRLLFNIVPEAAVYLGGRPLAEIARSTAFNARPDALCVSGLTAGKETSQQALEEVKAVVGEVPVFANTGVRLANVQQQLAAADGVVVGTTFKRDNYIWNPVDPQRVEEFMTVVRKIRG